MVKTVANEFRLIIIIVKKNLSREVVSACKEAGAEGGTVMQGRGTGTHETGSIFGVKIEPEKDIIFCLAPKEKVDNVLTEVSKRAELDKPGTGIAFVINSKNICGVAHLLDDNFNQTD